MQLTKIGSFFSELKPSHSSFYQVKHFKVRNKKERLRLAFLLKLLRFCKYTKFISQNESFVFNVYLQWSWACFEHNLFILCADARLGCHRNVLEKHLLMCFFVSLKRSVKYETMDGSSRNLVMLLKVTSHLCRHKCCYFKPLRLSVSSFSLFTQMLRSSVQQTKERETSQLFSLSHKTNLNEQQSQTCTKKYMWHLLKY